MAPGSAAKSDVRYYTTMSLLSGSAGTRLMLGLRWTQPQQHLARQRRRQDKRLGDDLAHQHAAAGVRLCDAAAELQALAPARAAADVPRPTQAAFLPRAEPVVEPLPAQHLVNHHPRPGEADVGVLLLVAGIDQPGRPDRVIPAPRAALARPELLPEDALERLFEVLPARRPARPGARAEPVARAVDLGVERMPIGGAGDRFERDAGGESLLAQFVEFAEPREDLRRRARPGPAQDDPSRAAGAVEQAQPAPHRRVATDSARGVVQPRGPIATDDDREAVLGQEPRHDRRHQRRVRRDVEHRAAFRRLRALLGHLGDRHQQPEVHQRLAAEKADPQIAAVVREHAQRRGGDVARHHRRK